MLSAERPSLPTTAGTHTVIPDAFVPQERTINNINELRNILGADLGAEEKRVYSLQNQGVGGRWETKSSIQRSDELSGQLSHCNSDPAAPIATTSHVQFGRNFDPGRRSL